MRWTRRVVVAAAILLVGPQAVRAQILDTRLRTATSTVTTDQLLERIVALEARVARLEGLLAVVNGTVTLDGRGAPVLIRGGSITIQPDMNLLLRAGNQVTIDASGSLMFRASAGLSIEASGQLGLKGSTIMLNNGTRPVACLGALTSAVPGTTAHVHQLTGQGCGATVLVP